MFVAFHWFGWLALGIRSEMSGSEPIRGRVRQVFTEYTGGENNTAYANAAMLICKKVKYYSHAFFSPSLIFVFAIIAS